MNANDFKKLLGYAILGMSSELKSRQQNVLLRERFGKDAILFAESTNPTRQNGDLQSALASCAELHALLSEVVSIRDHIREKEIDELAARFKAQYQ